MARRPDGWRLQRHERTGLYYVRFRHEGQRRNLSTGERDPQKAAQVAARLYAEHVSGRRKAGRPVARGGPAADLADVAALWLESIESSADATTWRWHEGHIKAHLLPYFEKVDQLTTNTIDDYKSHRLRSVKRPTVNKELTTLRALCAYAHARGYLAELPTIKNPPTKSVGKAHPQGKRETLVLTEEQAEAIIDQLAERSAQGAVLRDRAIFSWETGLRPEGIAALSVPENYKPGATVLRITKAVDKVRYDRDIPLTDRALQAIARVAPAQGLIFGPYRYWLLLLKEAARKAGIPEDTAKRMSAHAFRHSRLTYWAERTKNLAGLQYLAGHKHLSTTAKYVRANQSAAEAVLRDAIGSNTGRLVKHRRTIGRGK